MNARVGAQGSPEDASLRLPHLSHSRVSKYLLCPEQYRLHYVENLRPRVADASLVFGQIVHQALNFLFRTGKDPLRFFQQAWDDLKTVDLNYGERESWEKLRSIGAALSEKFIREEFPKLGTVRASEKPFTLTITNLGVPFVGVIDLVSDLDGKVTVTDFKTAASAYQEHEAALSDQLTAYQLAEPTAEQSVLCVFTKTKTPQIEWHKTSRHPEQLGEYLAKVEYVGGEITAGRFYKRPGRWCSYCDYLPVCMGDQQKIQETLVQVAPHS